MCIFRMACISVAMKRCQWCTVNIVLRIQMVITWSHFICSYQHCTPSITCKCNTSILPTSRQKLNIMAEKYAKPLIFCNVFSTSWSHFHMKQEVYVCMHTTFVSNTHGYKIWIPLLHHILNMRFHYIKYDVPLVFICMRFLYILACIILPFSKPLTTQ